MQKNNFPKDFEGKVPLDKSGYPHDYFSYFSIKTYVVGTH